MPNDPAVSAIPWGLEMTGRAVLWVMDRSRSAGTGLGHVLSRASPLEGEAASALIFHPISKPTVNDYVPFFGAPGPPPTDRKFWKKQKPTAQKIFWAKKIRKTECGYLSMWAQIHGGYRYLTKAWVWG
jgi:hypothetical protein